MKARIRNAMIIGCASIAFLLFVYISFHIFESKDYVSNPKANTSNTAQRKYDNTSTDDSTKNQAITELASDEKEKLKPITWSRPKFDDQPMYFSEEDLKKAKKIIAGHFNNYSKIKSLKSHEVTKTTIVRTSINLMLYMFCRGNFENSTFDIEATRSPLFFKISGAFGDGKKFEDIVTPVGEIAGGKMEHVSSWVPMYLDGERCFLEYSLLKYGRLTRENVSMKHDIPQLKGIIKTNKIDEARYDIIETNKKISDDFSIRKTYWFNRETGLLELGMGYKSNPKKDENPFYEAFVITYYDMNGIYYPKQILGYYKDFRLKREENITELEINGVKVQ